MGGRTFLTTLLLGKEAAARLRATRNGGIRDLPDRRLMAESYLPALAAMGGRILWVGCRAYTAPDYAPIEARGAEVWTTDIDPLAARWGLAGRHRTGDVCEIDQVFADVTFDAIVCNGVLGYGVDAPGQQSRALGAMAAILRPGGILLLGWNTDRTADPVAAGLAAPWFNAAPFAGQAPRVCFGSVTHIYDSLVRRPESSRGSG